MQQSGYIKAEVPLRATSSCPLYKLLRALEIFVKELYRVNLLHRLTLRLYESITSSSVLSYKILKFYTYE